MAELIEAWLGNPITRSVLKFCTKKCSCGRRIELILKNYVGDKQEMCMGCRTANYIVTSVLDNIISKSPIAKKEVIENLKLPVFRKGLCSVLEGIARYGVQKPFTGNSPFLVVWNITRACNLNCKHCLDYDTPLMVEENNEIKICKIGEVVDRFVGSGSVREKDGYEIADIPDNISLHVYSMDGEKGKTVLRRVSKVMRKRADEKKLVEVKAIGGVNLKLTMDHLVFTKGGWKEVENLTEGDYLTIPYSLTPPENIEKINIMEQLIGEPNLRISGMDNVLRQESEKMGLLRNEFAEMEFSEIPKSTREGWVYGYGSMPLSATTKFINKNDICINNTTISSIGSQEKEIPSLFEITPSLARLFGYFVSDGHFTKGTNRLSITNIDDDILREVISIFSSLGYSSYLELHESTGRAPQVYTNSHLLHLLFTKVFGLKSYAKNKSAPKYIFNCKKEVIREFLSACFSGDGSISNWGGMDTRKNRNVSFSSLSLDLIHGVSVLLWQMGVPHSIQRYPYRNYITIPPNFHSDFLEKVGFATNKKNDKLKVAEQFSRTYKKFSRWVVDKENNTIFTPIVSIKPSKPTTGYVYDLGVETLNDEGNFFVGFPPVRVHNCYEDAHVAGRDELTPSQRLKAVDKLAEAGIASIAISGGEPLVLPEFFDVAKRIRDNEMMFSIATNATLITKEKAKQLRVAGCEFVQISLDGAVARTHNAFRGRNAFQSTLRGIRNSVSEGLFTGISMTVTKYNYMEVPAVIDLAEKLGVQIFMHYNFIPTGRGKGIVNMDITPQEREELLEMLAVHAGKRKLTLLSTAPQYSRICMSARSGTISLTHFDIFGQTQDADMVRFLADFIGGCGAARLYCAMEPNGDIEPCVFIPIKIGNILKDDIQTLWHESEVLKEIREREHFKENCGVCEYRNVCGGCRARAYGYYHDLKQCDPGCMKNLEAWNKLKGIKKVSVAAKV